MSQRIRTCLETFSNLSVEVSLWITATTPNLKKKQQQKYSSFLNAFTIKTDSVTGSIASQGKSDNKFKRTYIVY